MLDDMLDYLSTVREKPAWQPLPESVRKALKQPLQKEPQELKAVYQEFLENVLPYTNGNRHPRFWGWVQGNGTPLGMMADMLASGMNPHLAGFSQAPTLVEHQVLAWLTGLMGFPASTSGVLVTGGTIANITALIVARNAKAGFDVRELGLQRDGNQKLMVYGSSETHSWAQKAVELLGMGNRAFRRIATDDDFRIDLSALRRVVSEDRAAGLKPICVIGTAGTVNTGATDDLTALAEFCREE